MNFTIERSATPRLTQSSISLALLAYQAKSVLASAPSPQAHFSIRISTLTSEAACSDEGLHLTTTMTKINTCKHS